MSDCGGLPRLGAVARRRAEVHDQEKSSRSRRTRPSSRRSSGATARRASFRSTWQWYVRNRQERDAVKTRRTAEMARGIGGAPASPSASSHARWRVVPRPAPRSASVVEHRRVAVLGGGVPMTFGPCWARGGRACGRALSRSRSSSRCWPRRAIKSIAQQWEKVVVLRFGTFNRVSGPAHLDVSRHRAEHHVREHWRCGTPRSGGTSDLNPEQSRGI